MGSELLPLQVTETGFPSALSYSLITVFTEFNVCHPDVFV